MNVNGRPYRSIWPVDERSGTVRVIDQRELPHRFVTLDLIEPEDYVRAIADMAVRGAGLIGATAAWGMWSAAVAAPESRSAFDAAVSRAAESLIATRPTASNLRWAVDRQRGVLSAAPDVPAARDAARREAQAVTDGDVDMCRSIGRHGLDLLRSIRRAKDDAGRRDEPIRLLTHCNAGWLAFADVGSATAPIYAAHDAGLALHVWVDETRPRLQGAALTAWELGSHGIPHDIIADNAGGHLMQHGLVDLVMTGADRVTSGGDAANKIGTYLKALAARDNGVPFYVAFPSSTFDWSLDDGLSGIPIEERGADEVRRVRGRLRDGSIGDVMICPEDSGARNWAFDVTPRRLISGLITERGVCAADPESIAALFPEFRSSGISNP